MERLQRVLSQRGVASRRRAEEMIVAGRVRVDGRVVTELGTKVDPDTQKIEVDGMLIPNPRRRYILLNKPSGYITTMSDERDRWTVMDLVHVNERVVPVGRLDRQTEGLLLLTNDGELANRVMHPRYELDKEYEALLDGFPPPEVFDRLRRGIVIEGERAVPEVVRPIRNTEDGTIVRIIIHEGRNRIVRRMFEEVGYPVLKLVRTRIGPLQVAGIPRGTFRDLTDGELRSLREAVDLRDEDIAYDERIATRPVREAAEQGRPRAAVAGRERPQGGAYQGAPAPRRGGRPSPRPGQREQTAERDGKPRRRSGPGPLRSDRATETGTEQPRRQAPRPQRPGGGRQGGPPGPRSRRRPPSS